MPVADVVLPGAALDPGPDRAEGAHRGRGGGQEGVGGGGSGREEEGETAEQQHPVLTVQSSHSLTPSMTLSLSLTLMIILLDHRHDGIEQGQMLLRCDRKS